MDKVVKLDSVTPGVTFKEDSTLLGTEDITPRTPRHGFKFQSHSAHFKTGILNYIVLHTKSQMDDSSWMS